MVLLYLELDECPGTTTLPLRVDVATECLNPILPCADAVVEVVVFHEGVQSHWDFGTDDYYYFS